MNKSKQDIQDNQLPSSVNVTVFVKMLLNPEKTLLGLSVHPYWWVQQLSDAIITEDIVIFSAKG